jgi:hypothetical protein
VSKFQATLLLMLLAAIIFFIACVVRLVLQVMRGEQPQQQPQQPTSSQQRKQVAPSSLSAAAIAGRKTVVAVLPEEGAGKRRPWPAATNEESSEDGASSSRSESGGDREDEDEGSREAAPAVASPSSSSSALDASPSSRRPRGGFVSTLLSARRSGSGAWLDFKERLQHSFLILMIIFYLRLTLLELKAFQCATLPNPPQSTNINEPQTSGWYLLEDGSTHCLQSEHLWVLSFVILLLAVYNVGLPLFCFVLLMRAFADESTSGVVGYLYRRFAFLRKPNARVPGSDSGSAEGDVVDKPVVSKNKLFAKNANDEAATAEVQRSRAARYGILFREFQTKHFAAGLQVFFIHVWFAWVSTFIAGSGSPSSSSSGALKLFLLGLVAVAQASYTAVSLPYITFHDNVLKLLIFLAQLAHTAIMIGAQQGGTTSPYFIFMVTAFSLVLVMLLVRQDLKLPCGREGSGQNKRAAEAAEKLARKRAQLDSVEMQAQKLSGPAAYELREASALRAAEGRSRSSSSAGRNAVVPFTLKQTNSNAAPVAAAAPASPLRRPSSASSSNRVVLHAARLEGDMALTDLCEAADSVSQPLPLVVPERKSSNVRLHTAAAAAVAAVTFNGGALNNTAEPKMFSGFLARSPTLASQSLPPISPPRPLRSPSEQDVTDLSAAPPVSLGAPVRLAPITAVARADPAAAAVPSSSGRLFVAASIVAAVSAATASGAPSVGSPVFAGQSKRMLRQAQVLKRLTKLQDEHGLASNSSNSPKSGSLIAVNEPRGSLSSPVRSGTFSLGTAASVSSGSQDLSGNTGVMPASAGTVTASLPVSRAARSSKLVAAAAVAAATSAKLSPHE